MATISPEPWGYEMDASGTKTRRRRRRHLLRQAIERSLLLPSLGSSGPHAATIATANDRTASALKHGVNNHNNIDLTPAYNNCMWVCVSVCMYICTCVYICIHKCVYMHVGLRILYVDYPSWPHPATLMKVIPLYSICWKVCCGSWYARLVCVRSSFPLSGSSIWNSSLPPHVRNSRSEISFARKLRAKDNLNWKLASSRLLVALNFYPDSVCTSALCM